LPFPPFNTPRFVFFEIFLDGAHFLVHPRSFVNFETFKGAFPWLIRFTPVFFLVSSLLRLFMVYQALFDLEPLFQPGHTPLSQNSLFAPAFSGTVLRFFFFFF